MLNFVVKVRRIFILVFQSSNELSSNFLQIDQCSRNQSLIDILMYYSNIKVKLCNMKNFAVFKSTVFCTKFSLPFHQDKIP